MEYSYDSLLGNARRVLIGEVDKSFRGIAIEWQDKNIVLYFYVEDEITEAHKDLCSTIGTELVACYSDAGIYEKVIQTNTSVAFPEHAYWVYRKKDDADLANFNYRAEYKSSIYSQILFALLGKIYDSIRGVSCEQQDDLFVVQFYIDGFIDNEMKKNCENIVVQVKRNNPEIKIHFKLNRLDSPQPLPRHGLNWVFKQRESSIAEEMR